ncbi:MAG: ABC transporter permease [Dehalococcoidales bacterium]|jgi:peptide/nickel transport system permease protein|nr:ABC transporter permease [Dehalococcoidales bacterium]
MTDRHNGSSLARYYWERARKNRLAVAGLVFIIFLILMGLIGPFFTANPTAVNFEEKNRPPVGFAIEESVYDFETQQLVTKTIIGTAKHPLGTDNKGRDLLAMIVSGTRVSLMVGLFATGIAVALGTLIGVTSAYFGGLVDHVVMRFTDIMMTFPFFLIFVLIIFIFGPSLLIIVVVIGLTGWTGTARLIRSETLSLRTREFIMAAKALGASDKRIILTHLVPNVVSLIIVIATLSIPGVILAEAALSFIGLGDPLVTSWGMVLRAGQQNLGTAWWVAIAPGIMLFFTVLAFNFMGDGLRDAFDPRSTV